MYVYWFALKKEKETYNGILFSLKKEENSDNAAILMNLEDIMLSEISQLQKKINTV